MGHLSLLFGIILCLLFEFPSFSFSSSHSSCLPDQSSALLQFKASFTINASFAHFLCDTREAYLDKPATWESGTDCCSWLGVTCDRVSGHVIGLDLSCAGLEGKIHPNSTLFHLTHLQTLNLAWNDFSTSHLPSQFGGLVSLTHLNLSQTNFEVEIPSQISHLSKLVSLDLSCHDCDGIVTWEETTWRRLVKNATSLRELVLDYTDMSSIRPLNLSSSLVTLGLSYTGLRGNLASDIFCLPNLQHLYLSGNEDLQSQLEKLSYSSSLSVLDLSSCQLQGSILPSFSNLSHLTSLTLSFNHINGSIPSSLLTLPSLTSLDLSDNDLSGQIPDVFPQSNRFQELQLSDNKIEGVLPSSLSKLHHLILLDLSSNKFSGQIPNVFGGLTKLKTLYLGSNNFRGQIPSSLFDLTQLSILDCSSNKLEGPLPKKITGFSNLVKLCLDDNLLNETIPSWCLSLPSLIGLDLSSNQFTGNISAISSYSLKSLYLPYNKLQGNIPESIFNLVNLSGLDLSSNNLSGHLDFQLFSKLENLVYLSLSHNSQLSLNFKSNVNFNLSYLRKLELSSLGLTKLPNFYGNFLGLKYLDLSFNLLGGDISWLICNASSLQILKLSHNKFTGTIPQCLGNLPNLKVLDLQMNKLQGTLPSNFSKKNHLHSLDFNGNQLEGPLPKSLSQCMALELLDLGNNQIKDTFPHWLQSLPDLRVLVLRGNKFDGSIASTKVIHPFPSLMIFDISDNNFSGRIPYAYIENFQAMKNVFDRDEVYGSQYMEISPVRFDMTGGYHDTLSVTLTIKEHIRDLTKIPTIFAQIDLSLNIFEGEIPNVIGELHALKGLNLSHNRFTGPIPRSMENLTNLESLDLSSNMLAGGIPTELTNINSLAVLNLSCNRLVGEIPHGKQFNTFSSDSYEENLGLCGFPLSKKCHMTQEQHSPPSAILWKEEKFGFGWKPVAIGYGCGMVFGVGLGWFVFSIGKPQWLVRMFGGQPNKKLKRRTKRRTHGTMNQLVQMS